MPAWRYIVCERESDISIKLRIQKKLIQLQKNGLNILIVRLDRKSIHGGIEGYGLSKQADSKSAVNASI